MKYTEIRLQDLRQMLTLCLKKQLGQRYWLIPAIVLVWPLALAGLSIFDINPVSFNLSSVQNWLLGLPLNLLAVGIGIGIIADEVEKQTLEVSYTVPGGLHRVWLYNLISLGLILFTAAILLSLSCLLLVSTLPSAGEFYRAMQAAIFFLVTAMALGCFFKSKLLSALICLFIYVALISANFDARWSPLFNPVSVSSISKDELYIWILQNHIGIAAFIYLLCILSFSRAQRPDLMLKD